jgi:multiple antibiotic resistance protein
LAGPAETEASVGQALVSLFVILDPLGNILVFQLYSQTLDLRQRLTAAAIAVITAFFMLLAFGLGGQEALDFLGISQASFNVAAGLLLMPGAYRLIMEGEPAPVAASHSREPLDFALVPLATPLIAGPGALAATTTLAVQVGTGNTLAAMTVILLLTFLSFAAADWLFRLLGEAFLRLAARVVGIVLFAIAVDFVLDGLRTIFVTS